MERKWYIGVDGGGTKTAVAISASDENPVIVTVHQGCSYQTLGVMGAVEVVCNAIAKALQTKEADVSDWL